MSTDRSAGRAHPKASVPTRFLHVWRGLPQERRLAALACVGLFLTLFLPWYQETVFANGVTSLRSASSSLTGWGAFSFVEAAVLLVAAAVLILLFSRAERQAFHVPGGDGGVITAAGLWTCILIIWRIFDKEGTSRHDQIAYTSGIEWGIFVALGVAAVLTYAGSQIRLAHEPEPPLPGEDGPASSGARRRRRARLGKGSQDTRRRATPRRTYPGPDMGAEVDWSQEVRARRTAPPPGDASEAPTRRSAPPAPDPSEAPTRRSAPPPPDPSEAPTRRTAPSSPDASEAPTQRVRPRALSEGEAPAGAVPRRRPRPLDRREIQELDIAEPPTARLGRSAPAAPAPQTGAEPDTGRRATRTSPPDPSDDQVTIRLDRPD
jgi:hypothetical protein